MLHSLFDAARQAQASQDVKAIVVTGAKGRFSAGFDIAQFQKSSGGGGVDMRYNLGHDGPVVVQHASAFMPKDSKAQCGTRWKWLTCEQFETDC